MKPRSAMRFLPALALSALLVSGCSSSSKSEPAPSWPAVQNSDLGAMHNVSRIGDLWFGGSPTAEDLDLARRRGIERIVDLTSRAEAPDYEVGAVVAGQDREYHDLRIETEEEIPDGTVDRALELLADDKPTLMFCGDGARCALIIAIHRVVDQEVPIDRALLDARRCGIDTDHEAFIRRQIDRVQANG